MKDSPSDALATEDALERVQCGAVGTSAGSPLVALEQMFAQVFLPLLGARTATGDEFADNLTSELLGDASKFGAQVRVAASRLRSDVALETPEDRGVRLDRGSVDSLARDERLVGSLERLVEDWSAAIAATMRREAERTVVGGGPLGEIEYWRARNAALSSLHEQLTTASAQRAVEVCRVAPNVGGSTVPRFDELTRELTTAAAEAKDNVKFLTTLERHFKSLTQYKLANNGRGTLQVVIDTIAPMINALRMVWIISRPTATTRGWAG